MSTQNTSTLTAASQILDFDASSYNDFKKKELGLQLILLGLAEVHATRLSKLATVIGDLEEEIFSPSNLSSQNPKEMLDLYKMSVQMMESSSTYIKSTISGMKWTDLEVQLSVMKSTSAAVSDTETSADMSSVAKQLLTELSKFSKPSLEPVVESVSDEI